MMEKNNPNVLEILTFVGVVAILLLGVTGNLGSKGLTKSDLDDVVKSAATQPTPTPTPAPAPTPQPVQVTKVDKGELTAFYDNTFSEGNQGAKVSIIEFSDVECPFCQRQTNNGTLDQVMVKYGDDVNVVFAHFPLSIHSYAEKANESLECAAELGGEDAFFAYKKALFAKGGQPTMDVIKAVSTEQGLDVTKMEECVTSGKYAQKVADEMNFGRKLGVTGTPGNIVMNNETGEFVSVPGAVPPQAFDAAITQFIGS